MKGRENKNRRKERYPDESLDEPSRMTTRPLENVLPRGGSVNGCFRNCLGLGTAGFLQIQLSL